MTLVEMHTLLREAEARGMTPEKIREQKISFAYGNANIENAAVTREVVEVALRKFEENGPDYSVPALRNVPAPQLHWKP